jgi:hypothetical protein
MLRTFVCAVLALSLFSGVALAGKGKKGKALTGKITKIDAAKGTLTVKVKVKKEKKDLEIKVDETTKVFQFIGAQKKDLSGKDVLKNELFKEGARIQIVADKQNKVREVRLGDFSKKKKKTA